MLKYLFLSLYFFVCLCGWGQDTKGDYAYRSFPIAKSGGQVVLAGDVHTVVYPEYYGRDVRREGYTDAHARPEALVVELFRDMKAMDLGGIARLYDTTFHRKDLDITQLAAGLKDYEDIRFRSKFRCGDIIIIRYDFVGKGNPYSYFAVIRSDNGKYYLTARLNMSEPFHVVGSLSPDNLFDRPEEPVNTSGMTTFYFVRKDGKILFTNSLPPDEYAALYISFESYIRVTFSDETEFVRKFQQAVRAGDTAAMMEMIAPDQLTLLKDPYYSSYYYQGLWKIFRSFPNITPLEGIRTRDGRVVYFSYADSSGSGGIASMILKSGSGRYHLGFRLADEDISNVLQNAYVREAIVDFMQRKVRQ